MSGIAMTNLSSHKLRSHTSNGSVWIICGCVNLGLCFHSIDAVPMHWMKNL